MPLTRWCPLCGISMPLQFLLHNLSSLTDPRKPYPLFWLNVPVPQTFFVESINALRGSVRDKSWVVLSAAAKPSHSGETTRDKKWDSRLWRWVHYIYVKPASQLCRTESTLRRARKTTVLLFNSSSNTGWGRTFDLLQRREYLWPAVSDTPRHII